MRTFGVALVVAFALMACGGDADTKAPANVVGTIVEVEPDDGQPTSFVVETEDGETYTIEVDPKIDYGFDLAHLHEHHESEDPVDVDIDERDGTLYALSIEDV